MNKQDKKALIPELRFPEFRDASEWEEKSLGQVVKNITTGKLDANAMVENGKYRFYTCAKNYYKIDQYAFDTEALLIAGNGAYLGYIHHYKGKFNAYQRTYVLYGFDANVLFLKYFLDQNLHARIAIEKKEGNTPYIVLSTITDTPLSLPDSKEQKKIASCLSSLDDYISAQNQKLEALKVHKKGLMQQLFPTEGELVPKLRFEEYRDDGEWEDKNLEHVCKINSSVGQLPQQFIYVDLESVKDGILLQKKLISIETAPSRAQRLLENNDVIFQMVRPYQRNNYFYSKNDNYDYVASTGYAQLRAFQSSKYLYQYIHTDRFVENVLAKCTGSNYPAINSTDLSFIPIQIPPNPKEQQKIADCLSSIDDLINAQTQKIELLKAHKKGLMQGLFPEVN